MSIIESSFFFQAEDGIRDLTVTGVQTCALPISAIAPASSSQMYASGNVMFRSRQPRGMPRQTRSEERRVGKECRSGGSAEHYRKKDDAALSAPICLGIRRA